MHDDFVLDLCGVVCPPIGLEAVEGGPVLLHPFVDSEVVTFCANFLSIIAEFDT